MDDEASVIHQAVDCGTAENLTRVTLELEANFSVNAYYDAANDQAQFLASTTW